jgi:hypothetical protein
MRCCVRMRLGPGARGRSVIKTRRAQRSFGDGLIAQEVTDLYEPWMKHADRVLDDKEILAAIYEALARRHPQSRKRGRPGTPAEVVLRLLVLKHMRNWSYAVLEREVRANLVYRDFTRVGGEKMPDAKTMGKWPVGPEVVKQIHERIVQIAHDHRVAQGRRLRVDTTVVETNIHYPTDSSLLGDGVRVLTRMMKKVTAIAGAAGAKLRDRRRSVKLRVLEIARAARAKGQQSKTKLARAYRRLLEATGRVAGGRRMRVDTTVVETNIHYPTDSSLLGDGVRVLTRTMKKITKIAGAVGAKLRDRSRSVKLRMLEIARAARAKGQPKSQETGAGIPEITRSNRPGGWSSQALCQGDRRGRQAGRKPPAAAGIGTAASRAGDHGAAGAAGDAPNQGPHLCRRHSCRRQNRQPVRAHDRGDSQR